MGMQVEVLETFESAKIRRRRKKSPAKFRKKIKITFLGHDYFPLLELKMCFFVKESAAKLTPFYLCKNSFSKIQFFLQILSPIQPCAILCACNILCAPTVCYSSPTESDCGRACPFCKRNSTLTLFSRLQRNKQVF